MLVAGVVGHEVDEDADAAALCLAHEEREIADVAVTGIDAEVVGDVVTVVAPGRGVKTAAATGS